MKKFLAKHYKLSAVMMGLAVGGAVVVGSGTIIVFLSIFDANICYSDVISQITEKSLTVMEGRDVKQKRLYQEFVKGLPNYGYETDCAQMQKYVEEFDSRKTVQ